MAPRLDKAYGCEIVKVNDRINWKGVCLLVDPIFMEKSNRAERFYCAVYRTLERVGWMWKWPRMWKWALLAINRMAASGCGVD